MNTEQEIKNLKQQIQELITWKEQKTRQQINFPLDVSSIDVLNKYFMRIIDKYIYFGGAAGNPFLIYEGRQDKIKFDLTLLQIEYVVNPTTDIIAILNPNEQTIFVNDQTLVLFTTDTEPGGLSGSGLTTYYVVNASSDGFSFQLSLTLGGATIDITSTGVGRQFLTSL